MEGLEAGRMGALYPNFFSLIDEKITALEKGGKRVIRLDIGSPDMPPPEKVITRLKHEVGNPESHGYQSHRGAFALRQAWALHYQQQYGVSLDPEGQVLPLIGSKEGIFHLSLSVIEDGDLVLVPDPGYQTYTVGARFSGGTPQPVPCFSGEGFLQALSSLPEDVLERAKLLWVNFPHNPTGATVERALMKKLVALAKDYDILLCHDAAYTRVTYGEYRAPSILEVPGAKDVCVEFNSLSKTYNMAGWRMGVVLGNRAVIEALYRLKTHADSGQFYPMMQAGAAGLEGCQTWIKERNERYQKRRDLVIEKLGSMGIAVDPPRGGIYIWFPVLGDLSSQECVQSLLEEVQVALTPGTVFGANGEGFLRLSLTSPIGQLREGMERLSRGFSKLI
ncbi:MAG: aminotransferase class I/II-fold pyridoxal phosphate-dependent enzyme [Anaerolineales bacterium]